MHLSTTLLRSRPLVAALALLLGASACQGDAGPTAPSLGTSGVTSCASVSVSQWGIDPQPVVANTSGYTAVWFIKNTGLGNVTLTTDTPVFTGRVTSATRTRWQGSGVTLGPGDQIDADVLFGVGAAGTGTIGLNVNSSCGTITLPPFTVTVN